MCAIKYNLGVWSVYNCSSTNAISLKIRKTLLRANVISHVNSFGVFHYIEEFLVYLICGNKRSVDGISVNKELVANNNIFKIKNNFETFTEKYLLFR